MNVLRLAEVVWGSTECRRTAISNRCEIANRFICYHSDKMQYIHTTQTHLCMHIEYDHGCVCRLMVDKERRTHTTVPSWATTSCVRHQSVIPNDFSVYYLNVCMIFGRLSIMEQV